MTTAASLHTIPGKNGRVKTHFTRLFCHQSAFRIVNGSIDDIRIHGFYSTELRCKIPVTRLEHSFRNYFSTRLREVPLEKSF